MFWGDVERVGLDTLEDEVVEKKRGEMMASVAKACSAGMQITLIMGGGALLLSKQFRANQSTDCNAIAAFAAARLLPVLFGHDVEDQEAVVPESTLLLQPGKGRRSWMLPTAKSRFFLMGGGATDEVPTAAVVGQEPEEDRVVVTARQGELVEGDGRDGEVVVVTKRRDTLRKARRLSRPLLRAMASSFAALLAARLFLGDIMAARIDPTIELLFSDDVVNSYAEKVDIPDDDEDEALPFSQDADYVPGRRKMRGRSVQRPPRPEGKEA